MSLKSGLNVRVQKELVSTQRHKLLALTIANILGLEALIVAASIQVNIFKCGWTGL